MCPLQPSVQLLVQLCAGTAAVCCCFLSCKLLLEQAVLPCCG